MIDDDDRPAPLRHTHSPPLFPQVRRYLCLPVLTTSTTYHSSAFHSPPFCFTRPLVGRATSIGRDGRYVEPTRIIDQVGWHHWVGFFCVVPSALKQGPWQNRRKGAKAGWHKVSVWWKHTSLRFGSRTPPPEQWITPSSSTFLVTTPALGY